MTPRAINCKSDTGIFIKDERTSFTPDPNVSEPTASLSRALTTVFICRVSELASLQFQFQLLYNEWLLNAALVWNSNRKPNTFPTGQDNLCTIIKYLWFYAHPPCPPSNRSTQSRLKFSRSELTSFPSNTSNRTLFVANALTATNCTFIASSFLCKVGDDNFPAGPGDPG